MSTEKSFPLLNELPKEITDYPRGLFDCFPSFKIDSGKTGKGYNHLTKLIYDKIQSGLRVLVIDGFTGVDWNNFQTCLDIELKEINISANWIDVSNSYASEEEIFNRIERFLGKDDRVFGTHFPGSAEVYFDYKKLADLRIEASVARGREIGALTIIYGNGAGLIELWDQLWYIDVPKDYMQEQARNGEVLNIGCSKKLSFEQFYKRTYFVDWQALNRMKQRLLPSMDLFIDYSYNSDPVSMDGTNFRKTLNDISKTPFRVRPWFYPGPWGGKYMQGHMGLDPKAPNFAWSFEIIVPENGVIIEDENTKMEFSFDLLMYNDNQKILGEAANQFKYEWPIRLDYLDTINGGNLSTQVHPRPDYIRKNFGETYTQDETYYIQNCKEDAKVYLGLTEDCNPEEFKKALIESQETGTEIDIDKFVNSEPAKSHDLFLIPNGTVHCSGTNNLVLEISATPYIFTFKIYDYVRRDLEGNMRPLNIERGFENIRLERKKEWVQKNLVAKPKLLEEGNGYKLEELYNSPVTFYIINRVEFQDEYTLDTKQKTAYAINVVEGEKIELISENNRIEKLNYLESMIIPSGAGEVKIFNKSNSVCKLIIVFIRPGTGIKYPVNDPIK